MLRLKPCLIESIELYRVFSPRVSRHALCVLLLLPDPSFEGRFTCQDLPDEVNGIVQSLSLSRRLSPRACTPNFVGSICSLAGMVLDLPSLA